MTARPITVSDVVTVLDTALPALAARQDVLRELDSAVGDGDLGITVARGCAAVRTALADANPGSVGEVLKLAGAAFARANPSTMAALVGAGLLAAAKETMETRHFTSETALTIGKSAYDRIAQRGKAELGDKTVLDALAPSLDALAQAQPGQALDAMIEAAQAGVDSTAHNPGRRGRASWIGERGIGHPDPGATFYVELLTAIRDAVSSTAASSHAGEPPPRNQP